MSWRSTIFTISFFSLACASCGQNESTVTPVVGNEASRFTIGHQEALRDSLPFEDKRDFDEHSRGFIAAPDYRRIADKSGNTVWDIGKYDFLLTGEDFDSIHPSLQRQATLNMNYGLFEVVPDTIYQVRGFDLANMTVIRGATGWIIFDVLLVKETAAAALELVNQQLGERPVVAVIYSHSHADHFGGIHGVLNEEDVRIHGPCDCREYLRRQRNDAARKLPIRPYAADQSDRAGRLRNWQGDSERCGGTAGADTCHRGRLRGTRHRWCAHGLSEYSGD
jgi:alkyl sulfatase BDS1-like metallo-beta-lactamase superfamily hydrolase